MKKILLVAVVIVVIVAVGCGVKLGLKGLGTGGGSEEGTQSLLSNVAEKTENTKEDANHTVIVKVDESNIYINDELCENVEALKEKISEIDSKDKNVKFTFEHEYAIKATYDEVEKALVELEEILDININYNE